MLRGTPTESWSPAGRTLAGFLLTAASQILGALLILNLCHPPSFLAFVFLELFFLGLTKLRECHIPSY